MRSRRRETFYRPREGILESLGVSKEGLRDAVFSSFANSKLDCHASLRDLPILLNGRTYRLEDVAYVTERENGDENA